MTHTLVASDRVEGTAVARPDGERIGSIQRLMIDKVSGQVAYAVLRSGGILGLGEKHHPVPWSALKYNLQLGMYELDVTNDWPRSSGDENFDWGDRSDEMVIRRPAVEPLGYV